MKKLLLTTICFTIGYFIFAQDYKIQSTTPIQQIGFKQRYSPVENKFSVGIQFGTQLHELAGGIQFTSPDLWKGSGVKLRAYGNVIAFNTFNQSGSAFIPYFDARLGILKSFELYETISIYTEIGGIATFNNTKEINIKGDGPISTVKMTNKKNGYGGYLKCGIEIRPRIKYGIFLEMGGMLTTNFAEQISGAPNYFANGYMINVGNRFYF